MRAQIADAIKERIATVPHNHLFGNTNKQATENIVNKMKIIPNF